APQPLSPTRSRSTDCREPRLPRPHRRAHRPYGCLYSQHPPSPKQPYPLSSSSFRQESALSSRLNPNWRKNASRRRDRQRYKPNKEYFRMQRRIKKAVFPVAGLGTRFLPATKAIPKEMLTIVDRPVIQLAVDEAREAGCEHFVFVTGRNKSVIEDHFDKQYELESTRRRRGKPEELALLEQDLPGAGQTSFTRQQEPLGLGHAVWCARELVGNEPFALLLPDMLIHARPGCLKHK